MEQPITSKLKVELTSNDSLRLTKPDVDNISEAQSSNTPYCLFLDTGNFILADVVQLLDTYSGLLTNLGIQSCQLNNSRLMGSCLQKKARLIFLEEDIKFV